MRANIDEQRILGIEGENLDTGKQYAQDFQGYRFSSRNKLMFVAHKKEIKLIELKNIGSTMGVFYCSERKEIESLALDLGAFVGASQIFGAWDEEKGNQYFFLPYFSPSKIVEMQERLDALGSELKLENSEKGVLARGENGKNLQNLESLEENISFLFGLTILYGKFEAKGEQLNSIKIHLPLFGQYLQLAEEIEKLVEKLQEGGIFLQVSKNENQGKVSFQISSNDYELLQIFALWYKRIENFSQITKKGITQQNMEELKAFLEKEQIENRDEIISLLEAGTVKVLIK